MNEVPTTKVGRDTIMDLLIAGFSALVGPVFLGAATLLARALPLWCRMPLIVGVPASMAVVNHEPIPVGIVLALVRHALF